MSFPLHDPRSNSDFRLNFVSPPFIGNVPWVPGPLWGRGFDICTVMPLHSIDPWQVTENSPRAQSGVPPLSRQDDGGVGDEK